MGAIGGYLGLLPFAGNCWIAAMLPAELQRLARAWHELLKKAGLRIAWQEVVWFFSAAVSLGAAITVSDVEITRRSREHGLKALGVWITFDGHFMKVSAWRCFYSLRNLLGDDKVALKHRLRLLSSCVVSSMY